MSLINLFVAARSAIARWRQRQRAYGELMALDDRALADIGIRREQIRAIVDGYHEAARRTAAQDTASDAALGHRQTGLAAGHR
jgi:uncharacterized protein YjiS (DUF1127 family)